MHAILKNQDQYSDPENIYRYFQPCLQISISNASKIFSKWITSYMVSPVISSK